MDLSVREVARILKVSETTVRGYIASGRLPAQRKGRQTVVSRIDLEAFSSHPLEQDQVEQPPRSPDQGGSFPVDGLQAVLDRMSVIEERLEHFAKLMSENSQLAEELRDRELELSLQKNEVERLRHQLEVQRRDHEKEIEAQARVFQEKCSLLERETSETIAKEREHLENQLSQEKRRWTERLAQEKENFTQRLLELQRQEGFWARLMKMMTWS